MNFQSVVLLVISFFFFTSCEKELSYERGIVGADDAVFTLGGSPSSCTGFVAGGTYKAGSALIANNTITFEVAVTSIGAYTFSTPTINGVTFNGSGSFTTTGGQTVTLTGSGTPTTAGDFSYSITSGSSSCTFSITVAAAGPVAIGTLDCTGITTAGTYTQGVALSSSNTISIPVNVATAGSYSVTTTTVNGCIFSGSGELATGAQIIVLTGSGTPTASGSNSVNISFGTSTCNTSIDFLPGSAPATDYLRCKIDGVATTFNINLAGTDPGLPTGAGFSIDGEQSNDNPSPSLSINLASLTGTITTGTYNLLSITDPTAPFCFPVYDDGSVTWAQGTSGQTGTFSVIVTAKTANRITGTFSGTLYGDDGASTTTKVITNGEFSVPY